MSQHAMDNLAAVPAVSELAVIINVETKYVSTLALLSTLRHLQIPTLLIDCESQDGSLPWFTSLQQRHSFYLIPAARRLHGAALDYIFNNAKSDCLVLVDSDLEILNDSMFDLMRKRVQEENIYGAGYLQRGEWLRTHYGTDCSLTSGIGYYMTRPWIPFSMFRTNPIRTAIANGASFTHDFVLNDLPQLPRAAHLLWTRFRFPLFRRAPLRVLDKFRREYEGHRPSYVFYDTGARIHEAVSKMRLSFGDVGAAIPTWSVNHLQGITRDLLQGHSSDAKSAAAIEESVLHRLKNEYGLDKVSSLHNR